MTDREQTERPRRIRTAGEQDREPEPEYVKNFQGDGALGANTAYGNSPRNSGAVFDARKP